MADTTEPQKPISYRVHYAIDAPDKQRIRLESSVFRFAIETLYHLVIGHKLVHVNL